MYMVADVGPALKLDSFFRDPAAALARAARPSDETTVVRIYILIAVTKYNLLEMKMEHLREVWSYMYLRILEFAPPEECYGLHTFKPF